MRRVPRVVPWATTEEWEWAYAALYSGDADAQLRAVRRLKAWASRGKVPHAVESTGNLVEISLRDAGLLSALSDTELRLQYSMAFIRFVNGLIDQSQKGAFAGSATAVAESLGLPAWFVELRHGATHDKLPPLSLLRTGRTHALDWLHANYWAVQKSFVADATVKVHSLLREFKDAQKAALAVNAASASKAADGGQAAGGVRAADDAEKEIQRVLRGLDEVVSGDNFPDLVVPVMLSPGFLVPVAKRKRAQYGADGTPAGLPHQLAQLWWRFIDACEAAWQGFAEELVVAVVEFVASAAAAGEHDDHQPDEARPGEAAAGKDPRTSRSFVGTLAAWAVSIIEKLGGGEQPMDLARVARACLASPGVLSLHILDAAMSRDAELSSRIAPVRAFVEKRMRIEAALAHNLRSPEAAVAAAAAAVSVVKPSPDASSKKSASGKRGSKPRADPEAAASASPDTEAWDARNARLEAEMDAIRHRVQLAKNQHESDSVGRAAKRVKITPAADGQDAGEGTWTLLDADSAWQPCPIGCLPSGTVPQLDLPRELDDVAVALQAGVLQIPVGASSDALAPWHHTPADEPAVPDGVDAELPAAADGAQTRPRVRQDHFLDPMSLVLL